MNNNFVIEVNENDFAEKIIEKSSQQLILVDFWAPWCGPCKQLTPILEKIVGESEGKFLLAKINIDENKQIASQLNIQSIPAVFAFKEKKIIDAFQGILPEQKIIAFLMIFSVFSLNPTVFLGIHDVFACEVVVISIGNPMEIIENHF